MRQILFTKCDGCDKNLLQNALDFLLQDVTVLPNCKVYYKMRKRNRFLVPTNHLKKRTS